MMKNSFDQYWHEQFQHCATLNIPDYEKSLYFKKDTENRYKLFLNSLLVSEREKGSIVNYES